MESKSTNKDAIVQKNKNLDENAAVLPDIVIFILGTTASGKSKLALDLAKIFSCEIINADSMQIYSGNGAGIMTAKPSSEDLEVARHHLYSELEMTSTVDFNVQKYQKMAQKTIEEVMSRGHIPIVVGGTNYYIESLLFTAPDPSLPKSEEFHSLLQSHKDF